MKNKTDIRWVVSVLLVSIAATVVFTLASEEALAEAGYILACIVLLMFIFIGIGFDIVGVAVTSATEAPFHSMASHKERGATEAIRLLRRAEKVSSICNDVVGDICGIVSGSTAAVVAANIAQDMSVRTIVMQLGVSALVAGLTIGGKAMGKAIAINNSTAIVIAAGKTIAFFKGIFRRK